MTNCGVVGFLDVGPRPILRTVEPLKGHCAHVRAFFVQRSASCDCGPRAKVKKGEGDVAPFHLPTPKWRTLPTMQASVTPAIVPS
jgi:hypothetical protein